MLAAAEAAPARGAGLGNPAGALHRRALRPDPPGLPEQARAQPALHPRDRRAGAGGARQHLLPVRQREERACAAGGPGFRAHAGDLGAERHPADEGAVRRADLRGPDQGRAGGPRVPDRRAGAVAHGPQSAAAREAQNGLERDSAAGPAKSGRHRRPENRRVPAALAAGRLRPAHPVRDQDHRASGPSQRGVAGVPRHRAQERHVHVPGHRPEVRPATVGDRDRARQGGADRAQHDADRQRARQPARRRLRQLLQHGHALLQGDPAGAAHLAPERRSAARLPDRLDRRRVRAAVHRGLHPHRDRARDAQSLPAVERGDHLRGHVAGRIARRRPQVPRRARRPYAAAGLFGGLRRPGPAVRAGVGRHQDHLRLRHHHRVPGAGGPVRELPRPAGDPDLGAAVDRRRARVHRHRHRRGEPEHLHPGGSGDADGPDQQARHPHRRGGEPRAGDRQEQAGRGGGGGRGALPPDPHDHRGDGARRAAPGVRDRRRRRLALRHRAGDLDRARHRHPVHPVRGAGRVHAARRRAFGRRRGGTGGTGRARPPGRRGGPRAGGRRAWG